LPRFYFHLRDHDQHLIPDEDGTELPDRAAAMAEAADSARDLAANAIREGRKVLLRIEVMDEAGQLLFTFPVDSVIN
jgi:protocatechuate 3,4-dioxygenase beta subunit